MPYGEDFVVCKDPRFDSLFVFEHEEKGRDTLAIAVAKGRRAVSVFYFGDEPKEKFLEIAEQILLS